jgi:hypothetical protein
VPLSVQIERGELSESHDPATDRSICSGTVLDIGIDTGALILYSDRDMVGEEIEICPFGHLSQREHNVVRARRTPTGLVYAAVFPSVAQGEYSVLTSDGLPSHKVSVTGGRVTEIDCRRDRAS